MDVKIKATGESKLDSPCMLCIAIPVFTIQNFIWKPTKQNRVNAIDSDDMSSPTTCFCYKLWQKIFISILRQTKWRK